MKEPFSLDGLRMQVVSTADNGVVNADTTFQFTQEGSTVSAHYSGGRVRQGYLVGELKADELCFRYCQLDTDGRLDGGVSTCEVSRGEDGRVRIIEHFEWQSREGAGTNIFEELPSRPD
ncbi:MAG: hypothetical protein KF784_00505 [Fimbriimonadaceae bacterium]|nr:hypothetical protein [Fimbriimonadaceae bacterium]